MKEKSKNGFFKRLVIFVIAIVAIFAFLAVSGNVVSADSGHYLINLPDFSVDAVFAHWGATSYWDTTVTGIGAGYHVWDGTWVGWCVDEYNYIYPGTHYTITLNSTYDPGMPWPDSDWDNVNYLINHKNSSASIQDIQDAIWYFIDGGNTPPTACGQSMVNDACAHGDGFIPSEGQLVAVTCDGGSGVQKTFIEVEVPSPPCEVWVDDDYTSSSCGGHTWHWDAFNTIQEGVDTVCDGGTVYVADGVFSEGPQIHITKDLTIQGQGCGSTIIKPTADTGSSGDDRGWFLVDAGKEFNLNNVELDGTGFKIWQAIRDKGYGTFQNVCFKEIKYEESGPSYSGVAIAAFGSTGSVDTIDCTFEEIGRVGILQWIDGTISGNTYTGKGDGNWLDYFVDTEGGVVTIDDNYIIDNRGIASSDGSGSAGILVSSYYMIGANVTITNNDIFDNDKGIAVGYDEFDTSTVVAHCNNIVGNIEGVNSTAPVVDATCNWWGDCSGPYNATSNPGGLGDNVTGNVNFDPWVGLVIANANGPYDNSADCSYTINFDGSGSYVPCTCVGETLTYDWDFGDGTAHGTGDEPTHTYSTFGEYTVTLTVTGSVYGCTNTSTTTATIYGAIANAGGPYHIPEDTFTVHFDGSGSTGYAMPLTYDWDFGDGTGWHNDIGATPLYTYGAAGTYNVTLRVTESGNGCSDTDTTTASVIGDDPPIVQLIYPTGGEVLSGTVTVRWYAIDSDYPQGVGLPIYLYYSANNGATWRQIDGVLSDNVDMEHGSYDWSVGSLSDGSYMLLVEAIDPSGNIAHDSSDLFTVGNGYTGVRVSDVRATDTTINNYNWVKNGDTVEITAGITGSMGLTGDDITADLSGFGMGTVIADSFDGFTATWTLTNVQCTPSDGPITVTVTADGIDSNSAVIVADNTKPGLSVYKPQNGLYFFNTRLLPFTAKTIIIGPITVELDTSDNSGVDRAEFYLDGELMNTDTSSSPEWYMNLKTWGQHNLEVTVYDNAGNFESVSQMITVYNFFGAEW